MPETVNTIRRHAELIDKVYAHTAPVGATAYAIGDCLDGYSKTLMGTASHPRYEMCDQKVAETCWFA